MKSHPTMQPPFTCHSPLPATSTTIHMTFTTSSITTTTITTGTTKTRHHLDSRNITALSSLSYTVTLVLQPRKGKQDGEEEEQDETRRERKLFSSARREEPLPPSQRQKTSGRECERSYE
ncbi:hypothetical protein E2C01_081579 [Portunus trituberculatus]|uniref:Uncharacterized protein n=1 Tax=Portunus trituberculatus TaxID=210409 RepID=A0A5B7IWQ9_PORTR|nr:hypothetical protein [Portunus trituberculatus]